jgi:hypothetical protein
MKRAGFALQRRVSSGDPTQSVSAEPVKMPAGAREGSDAMPPASAISRFAEWDGPVPAPKGAKIRLEIT